MYKKFTQNKPEINHIFSSVLMNPDLTRIIYTHFRVLGGSLILRVHHPLPEMEYSLKGGYWPSRL